MGEIFYGTKVLLLFGVIACVLVVVAMVADLVAGVYKSKMRGEYAQSELLKRTGYKFCLYEGSMLIALCVDVLIHFTHIYEYIGFPHVMFSLPLLTFLMAIFWCAVEYLSIREKASEKVHSHIAKVEKLASTMFTKEELVNILSQALAKAKSESENEEK